MYGQTSHIVVEVIEVVVGDVGDEFVVGKVPNSYASVGRRYHHILVAFYAKDRTVVSLYCAHTLPFVSIEVSSSLKNRSVAVRLLPVYIFLESYMFFGSCTLKMLGHCVEFFHYVRISMNFCLI